MLERTPSSTHDDKHATSEFKHVVSKSLPVALVDVDETLIRARSKEGIPLAIDQDLIDISEGLDDKYLNLDLIDALRKANITQLYLFTDMRHYTHSIKERLALITSLQKKGLTIHGVITPSDFVYNKLTDKQVAEFFACKSRSESDAFIDNLLIELNKTPLHSISGENSVGIAFKESVRILNEKTDNTSHIQKCDLAKMLTERLAHQAKENLHSKGLLYLQFRQYKPKDLGDRCLVIDDRTDVLESAQYAHDKLIGMQKDSKQTYPCYLTCVPVNLQTKTNKQTGIQKIADTIDNYHHSINPYLALCQLATVRANEYRKSLQGCCLWIVPHVKRKQLKLEAINILIKTLETSYPEKTIPECLDVVKSKYSGITNHALSIGKDAWQEILKGKETAKLFDTITNGYTQSMTPGFAKPL